MHALCLGQVQPLHVERLVNQIAYISKFRSTIVCFTVNTRMFFFFAKHYDVFLMLMFPLRNITRLPWETVRMYISINMTATVSGINVYVKLQYVIFLMRIADRS